MNLFGIGPLELVAGFAIIGLLVAATVFKNQPRKAGYCYLTLLGVVLVYVLIQGILLAVARPG